MGKYKITPKDKKDLLISIVLQNQLNQYDFKLVEQLIELIMNIEMVYGIKISLEVRK